MKTHLRRLAPVLAAGAVLTVLGATAYVVGDLGDSETSGNEPSLLRLTSVSDGAADGDAMPRGSAGPGGIRVRGMLPDGPGSATVRVLGRSDDDDVRRLATALGLDGAVQDEDGARLVTDGRSRLVVDETPGSPWRFARADDPMCPFAQPRSGGPDASVACAVEDLPMNVGPSGAEEAEQPLTSLVDARAAADLLGALGLDPADAAVIQGGNHTVAVDPVVAGLPTAGFTTYVTVDRHGVLRAAGWLAPSSAGPAYPIVSARAALDALDATAALKPAMACPEIVRSEGVEPGGAPDRCGTPGVVTGATLGRSLQWEGDRPLLVPTWLFDVLGWNSPLAQIAVDPSYLATPSADPGPRDDPEPAPPPSSPPGGGSEPGFPGTGTPTVPSEPDGSAATSRFDSVRRGDRPDQLVVGFYGGVKDCYSYRVEVVETPDVVRLSVVESAAGDGPCIELAQLYERAVNIERPLGDRTVVDGESGVELTVGG